ncbi:hypothetical protein AB0I81_30295 [Nonomuraea sp. NPDC050404]|uniref:hypothetical protein n=1 Tax=Nonomuraea sp. NPDC050404 TaxID=3155783 RepID=UPI0033E951B2
MLAIGITDPALIGARIGVHPRTVWRYLHELKGSVDQRGKGQGGGFLHLEIKPQVLEHFRRYPHLRIPAFQLARALRLQPYSSTVLTALRGLERDGLVRCELATRGKPGDLRRNVKVILWSLAEGQRDGE